MSCFQPVSIPRGRKLSEPRRCPTAGAKHTFQLCFSLSRRQTADHSRHFVRCASRVRSLFGSGVRTRRRTPRHRFPLARAACLYRCSHRWNFHHVIVNATPVFSRLRRNHYPLLHNQASFYSIANLVIESGANRFGNHCSFSLRLNAPFIVPRQGSGPHNGIPGTGSRPLPTVPVLTQYGCALPRRQLPRRSNDSSCVPLGACIE